MLGLLLGQGLEGLVVPVVPDSSGTDELAELLVGLAVFVGVGVAIAGFAPGLGKELNLVARDLDGNQFGLLACSERVLVVDGEVVMHSELEKELLGEGPACSIV